MNYVKGPAGAVLGPSSPYWSCIILLSPFSPSQPSGHTGLLLVLECSSSFLPPSGCTYLSSWTRLAIPLPSRHLLILQSLGRNEQSSSLSSEHVSDSILHQVLLFFFIMVHLPFLTLLSIYHHLFICVIGHFISFTVGGTVCILLTAVAWHMVVAQKISVR